MIVVKLIDNAGVRYCRTIFKSMHEVGMHINSGADNGVCSICLESFDRSSEPRNNTQSRIRSFCRQVSRRDDVIVTLYPCNHRYHKRCIKSYLIYNLSCPFDRQVITGSDSHFSWRKYLPVQLISAAEKGQLKVVQRIFDLKVKENGTFNQWIVERALILAVKEGHLLVAEELIKHGASDTSALYDLGHKLVKERSDTVSYIKAFILFQIAAERGDEKAQNDLGYLYLKGLGVSRDLADAKRWFEKSARNGCPIAQYNLGKQLYKNGDFTDRTLEMALSWLQKAVDQGYDNAQEMILEILELSNLPLFVSSDSPSN